MDQKTIIDSHKGHSTSPGKEEKLSNEKKELHLSLPRVVVFDGYDLYKYQNFWCPSRFLNGVVLFQKHFRAQDSDIMLVTSPKAGSTWLKALTFAIANRSRYAFENNPLLTTFVHQLVPFLELDLYYKNYQTLPCLEDLPTPRIFASHVPYTSLPNSVVNSNCRIVYMCRNPFDQFISEWCFLLRLQEHATHSDQQVRSLDEAFEMACSGVQLYGPLWDHVTGYWKASIEEPNKILFLKYEDLKEDINLYIKRLADFLGCPFSNEEEKQGVIEEISKLCSFDNMRNLEASKTGKYMDLAENIDYFRKGKVGDWKSYFTPSMAERLQKLMEENLGRSGLTFKSSLTTNN